jgi:hypothetical protein
LIPADLSFAQETSGAVKIYSGYLYQVNKPKVSIWHSLFGPQSHKQEASPQDRECSIEFHSAVSFQYDAVTVVPKKLTYFIKFKNEPPFSKFNIKIYTNDEEDYTIDPDSEGRQVGLNDEHHIYDAYLIYLILGSNINHIEIVSASSRDQDKYVLDKVEIHDNH